MTTRASDLTPADLVARARGCLTSGDEQGAIAAALVAIAEVMVTEPPVEVAEIPPGAIALDPEMAAEVLRAHLAGGQ